MHLRIDGEAVAVPGGSSILDACDAAGRYVPRLCHYPGLSRPWAAAEGGGPALWDECGLCVIRSGDGSEVLACATAAAPGMEIVTDDPELRAIRLGRLASILAAHPHICLSCPDRDGCSRDVCTYGNAPEARCCAEFGRCELGALVGFVDAALALPRRAVTVSRDAVTEGRIRREMGLCIGCGRCVQICDEAPEAGRALEMGAGDVPATGAQERPRPVARPKKGTLRASGCTFCGLCVSACPAGALSTPGGAGARRPGRRRAGSRPATPVLPPVGREPLTEQAVGAVPSKAGVLHLLDGAGRVLRITGAADVRRALTEALAGQARGEAAYFRVELDDLYTQRESELLARYAQQNGHLPPGNEVDDDLFGDDLP